MVRSWKNKFIPKENHVIKISRNVIYLEHILHVSTTHLGILVYHVRNVDIRWYREKAKSFTYRSCVWIWAMICLTSLNNKKEKTNVVKCFFIIYLDMCRLSFILDCCMHAKTSDYKNKPIKSNFVSHSKKWKAMNRIIGLTSHYIFSRHQHFKSP